MASFNNLTTRLDKLLLNTPEAYYWMGFIMADGHIESKIYRLSVTLAIKDKRHLIKLAKYIKCPYKVFVGHSGFAKNNQYIVTKCGNSKVIPFLAEKFDIRDRKTYEPPRIKIKNNDLFLSFLIGFIDGDGHLAGKKTKNIVELKIKCHKAWANNLGYMINRLSQIADIKEFGTQTRKEIKVKIYGNFAEIRLAKSKAISLLKRKTVELDLPVLKRKWNKVSERDFDKRIPAKLIRKVIKMYRNQKSFKEICKKLNINFDKAYNIVYKYWIKKTAVAV